MFHSTRAHCFGYTAEQQASGILQPLLACPPDCKCSPQAWFFPLGAWGRTQVHMTVQLALDQLSHHLRYWLSKIVRELLSILDLGPKPAQNRCPFLAREMFCIMVLRKWASWVKRNNCAMKRWLMGRGDYPCHISEEAWTLRSRGLNSGSGTCYCKSQSSPEPLWLLGRYTLDHACGLLPSLIEAEGYP